MFFFVLFIACHISSGDQGIAGITWTGDHVFVCWNIGYRLVSNCWKRGCRLLFIITPQVIVFQFSGQVRSPPAHNIFSKSKLNFKQSDIVGGFLNAFCPKTSTLLYFMTLSVKETDIKRHKIPISVNYEGTLIYWDGCFNVNVCG